MRVTGIGLHRSSTSFNLIPLWISSLLYPPHSRVTLSPSACFFNAKCSLLFARVYGRFGRGDRPAGEDFFQMLNARFVPTHLHVCHQLRVPSTGSHRTRNRRPSAWRVATHRPGTHPTLFFLLFRLIDSLRRFDRLIFFVRLLDSARYGDQISRQMR